MKCLRVSIQLAVLLFISMTSAMRLPPLPAEVSQVKAAKELVKETPLGELQPADRIARRLFNLASLEGDFRRPYAVHHQIQSQAFYRMMISQYFRQKLGSVYQALREPGANTKGITVSYPVSDLIIRTAEGVSGMYLTFPENGQEVYDRLIDEFWRNNADLFAHHYRARINDGREKKFAGDTFASLYHELPEDKKTASDYFRERDAAAEYYRHLVHVYHEAVKKYVEPVLKNDGPDDLRRLSSSVATTSGRQS